MDGLFRVNGQVGLANGKISEIIQRRAKYHILSRTYAHDLCIVIPEY